jgi:hypothetical protein
MVTGMDLEVLEWPLQVLYHDNIIFEMSRNRLDIEVV